MRGLILLDLKKLHYFITVANEASVTNAAKKLNMTQPPLSHQIKVLEDEIGVELMHKVGRNIELTNAGIALHDQGKEILESIKILEKKLKDIHNGTAGILSIGSATSWGAPFLSEQVAIFNERYPQVQFRFYNDMQHNIISLLEKRVIDFSIVFPPFNKKIYNYIAMPKEPLIAVMRKKWDDDPEKKITTFEELADKPLIINMKSERHLIEYYKSSEIAPNIVCVHDDVRSMLLLAKAGLGIALIPKAANWVKYEENDMVYKVVDRPTSQINPYIIWLKKHKLSNSADNFLKLIMDK